jgi:hypothetical protein
VSNGALPPPALAAWGSIQAGRNLQYGIQAAPHLQPPAPQPNLMAILTTYPMYPPPPPPQQPLPTWGGPSHYSPLLYSSPPPQPQPLPTWGAPSLDALALRPADPMGSASSGSFGSGRPRGPFGTDDMFSPVDNTTPTYNMVSAFLKQLNRNPIFQQSLQEQYDGLLRVRDLNATGQLPLSQPQLAQLTTLITRLASDLRHHDPGHA